MFRIIAIVYRHTGPTAATPPGFGHASGHGGVCQSGAGARLRYTQATTHCGVPARHFRPEHPLVTFLTAAFRDQLKPVAEGVKEPIADLTMRLTAIPAPTNDEAERAAALADILRLAGFADVSVDALHDVTGRIPGRRSDRCVLLAAHTDTVFPRTVDVTPRRDGERLFGPGIGDNTISIATVVLMKTVLDRLQIVPDVDIIVTGNVGEEGLGDLRGMRAVMDANPCVGAAVAVEGHALGRITHQGVGSRRFEVTLAGPGGHSWGDFGRPSAIHAAAKLVSALDGIPLPVEPKTTLNVGILEGGISVNTIAPEARMVIDMRSLDQGALERLVLEAERRIAAAGTDDIAVTTTIVGDRPAGRLPEDQGLVPIARAALELLGIEPTLDASSTDANIPISRRIPAICIGVASGGHAHREDEYIDLDLVPTGVTQLAMVTLEAARLLGKDEMRIVD
jgi:acetylornithine deacetylase/succinyl-diaminopimelate desuccinylase-like protein